MKYIDLINLGFKRKDVADGIHFERTGNAYFYLNYKLCNGVHAEWCPEKEGAPVGISFPEDTSNRFFVNDIDTLEKILIHFSKRKKK